MSSVNVRISANSYQILKTLSQGKGQSMQSVIDQAIEDLRRRKMLEATNLAFSEMKADKTAWREEIAEREIWANTLSDGVEEE
jgi:predicted CopG family antitoxin